MGIPFRSDTNFVDDAELSFGNSSDLKIYHSGSHSYISDVGTGNLLISGTNLWLSDAATGENFLRATSNGSVQIYHDGAFKFATTSTGVDVNGTINLDNLTINSAQGTDGQVLTSTGTGIAWEDATGGGASLSGGEASKVAVWSDTDTLTHNDNFHFDTTNVRLGIGDSNPNRTLVVSETRTDSTASDAYTTVVKSVQDSGLSTNPGTGGLKVQYTSSSSNVHAFGLVAGSSSSDFLTTGPMHFYTNSDLDTVSATGFAMQLDTSQRLILGSTTATQKLNVDGNVKANVYYSSSSTSYYVDPDNTTTSAILNGAVSIGSGSVYTKLSVSTPAGYGDGADGIFIRSQFAGSSPVVSDKDPFLSIGCSDSSGSVSTIFMGEDATATSQESKIEYSHDNATLGIFVTGQGSYREHVRFGNQSSSTARTRFYGNVGIGTDPSRPLHVVGTAQATTGFTTDGNNKFYTWRALENTASSSNQYYRIARITASQSTRFIIELAGRSTSYSDGSLPSFGKIVGQLNNDNNYDIVYYNASATDEVVDEVGQVDVSTSATDIYVRVGQYAELTATAHISDGTIVTYSGDSASTSAPTNYVQATEYKLWNTGNDGAGSLLDADKLDAQEGSYYLNYNNFTNTPTIPTNNNQLTNGAGYITAHPNISAATSSDNSGRTYIQDITLDSNGHVTGIATATESVTAPTNYLTDNAFDQGVGLYLTGGSYNAGTDTATTPLVIDEGDFIKTKDGGYLRNLIGKTTGDEIQIGQSGTSLIDTINFLPGTAGNSAVKINGNTVWNAGNDGSGTGLDADLLDGLQTTSSGDRWGVVPTVSTSGVLEAGKYIDFHESDTTTSDYDYRITSASGRLYLSGDLEVDGGDIYINDGNTRITEGSNNSVRIQTNSGYVDIGPNNSSYSHFYTDRGQYYFNKGVTVDTGAIRSYDEDLNLNRAGSTTARLRITSGITHSDQNFQVNGASTSDGAILDLQSNHSSGYNDSRITFSSEDGDPDGTIIYKNEPFKTRFEFYTQTTGTTGTISLSLDQSSAYFSNKVYAQEFIDRNATSYKIHPGGTDSRLNYLKVGSSSSTLTNNSAFLTVGLSSGSFKPVFRTFVNNAYPTWDVGWEHDTVNNSTYGDAARFKTNGTLKGYIRVNSSSVTYSTTSSDERLKKNIETWDEDILSKFEAIEPKKFHFNYQEDSDEKIKGYVAQQMVDKFPEAYPSAPIDEIGEEYYSFDPGAMAVYLMKAVKDLIQENKQLKQRVEVLENQ